MCNHFLLTFVPTPSYHAGMQLLSNVPVADGHNCVVPCIACGFNESKKMLCNKHDRYYQFVGKQLQQNLHEAGVCTAGAP